MIAMIAAAAIWAAGFQTAAADGARTSLRTCIKAAATEAKGQKIATTAFSGFVMEKCTAQAAGLRSAIWAFDSKNKVSRKQSESDSNMQIEDFVSSAENRYTFEMTPQ